MHECIFVSTKTKKHNNMKAQNTLIALLQNNGYRNTNTNRERAVRNINMLLDAGILQLTFVHADKYNDQSEGWGFWYNAQNGKRRCTNYKVTLYGNTYYGSFVPKRRTSNLPWGMGVSVDIVNNYTVDISDLQRRIARLISIIRGNGDFMKSSVFAKYGECSCNKCNGNGIIPSFMYYAEGICFDCGGSGVDNHTLKMYINDAIAMEKQA
jgi:hypothetical protein